MFKKIASDALGLSDIGKVIDRKDFDKVDSDDYVLHEEGERIYFIIKSKKDEYCFTNLALIHLDGESAVSSKRVLKRYSYGRNDISNVYLETAGRVDLDVEIKFVIGSTSFSIDVDKNQIEQVKDLYKALLKISDIKSHNAEMHHFSKVSLEMAKGIVENQSSVGGSVNLAEQFNIINASSYEWMKSKYAEYHVKDFGDVFEKFINQ
ncbi:PH domain-containing protein [Paenibacillus chungangensis]|uniref:PH domain-containing protein n=1 Tax=Paenibacillus chungangensis TaxID=696535 RepID=A0ABW3HXB1_9BACL